MTVQLKTLAVASLLACASYAQADVAFDANLELDTTYTNKAVLPIPMPVPVAWIWVAAWK